MSRVQTVTVGAGEGDQRLDRWFRRRFPYVSQGRIEKMCRKGEIRVDGGRVKPATRLGEGQNVRIPPLPDEAAPQPFVAREAVSEADARMIRAAVVYRDDHIIALNKPPGLPSQGGSKQTRHVDGLAEALTFGMEDKPRLVHRLDKDTSGLLLLARTRGAAAKMTQAFRARDTRKIYWAAVAGTPLPRLGTIRFGLVKASGHGAGGEGEKMLCLHPREVDSTEGAKRATTDYAVLSALGGRVSWVAMVPVTGRTHQLRAHMAELGHPIIGDGWGAQLGGEISRKLHLHARHLSFTHPVTGARVTLTAPLPEHMQRTWDTLGWDARDVPADPFEEMEP